MDVWRLARPGHHGMSLSAKREVDTLSIVPRGSSIPLPTHRLIASRHGPSPKNVRDAEASA